MILCCGDALIDMLPRHTPDGTAFLPVPGGAVFNTAVALGRLGAPAGFFAPLSTDPFGDLLRDALAQAGVDTGLCPSVDRLSTLAMVALIDGQATYRFYDERSAGRMLTEADLPALPGSVAALHLGAISLVAEPCGSAYEALAMRAEGRVLSLDPNIRPSFISDPAAHRARIARLAARADIVKVSDEDLAWLGGGFEDVAASWISGGASLVVMTTGAAPVQARTAGGPLSVPVTPAEVVDTVGAGDSFDAGLLAGLAREGVLTRDALRGADQGAVRRSLELAARVAAVTVSRAGANPPWAHELGQMTRGLP